MTRRSRSGLDDLPAETLSCCLARFPLAPPRGDRATAVSAEGRTKHRAIALIIIAHLALAAAADGQQATIAIEPGVVGGGGFAVRLDTTAEVARTRNDIVFDAGAPIAARPTGRPQCQVNPDIDKGAVAFTFEPAGCVPGSDCRVVRASIDSIENVAPIPSGSTLYTCALDATTPPGIYALGCENPSASDPSGAAIVTTCVGAMVEVAAGAQLAGESAGGVAQGATFPLAFIFSSNQLVTRLGATLEAAPATQFAADVSGAPRCALAGDSAAVAADFAFAPPCSAGASCVHLEVSLTTTDGAPLPTGLSFACDLAVDAAAMPGEYAVRITALQAEDAGGATVPADARDGVFTVTPRQPTPTPPATRLEIGSAARSPGDRVRVAVALHSDEAVGGVQLDVVVGPGARVAARQDGAPDCDATLIINGPSAQFAFLPSACGVDCGAVRAILIAAEVAIPDDGTALFTCAVQIAAGAAGSVPLACANPDASTPDGGALAVACGDGVVTVASSGGGGCAIDPDHGDTSGWGLLGPVLALVLALLAGGRRRTRQPQRR